MNFKNIATITGLAASAAVALAAAPAQAASLTAGDISGAPGCIGNLSCTVNGFTVTAGGTGDSLTTKIVGGIEGIGVEASGVPDPSGGEIDFGETLTLDFASGVIKKLDLSFLYQPGVFGDQVFEIAEATAGGATGLLTVTGNNTATWSLGGTVINLSPSTKPNGGLYSILNPFGESVVDQLVLTARLNGTATSFRNSDFSFNSIKVAAVPEPATALALIGFAGASLGLRRTKQEA